LKRLRFLRQHRLQLAVVDYPLYRHQHFHSVSRRYRRHHRAIDDAQARRSAHPHFRIHNAHCVIAHPARANRVVHGRAIVTHVLQQRFVGLGLTARYGFIDDITGDLGLSEDPSANLESLKPPTIAAL
jgi:hypothetical protein